MTVEIQIKSIHARDNSPGVVLSIVIVGENGIERKSLPLTEEQYLELKPKKGLLSIEEYEKIESASSLCRTMRQGMNILSYSSHSGKDLKRRLRQKGASLDDAEATVAYMQAHGYIREKDDAIREAEKCLRKLWSERHILAYLFEKGYTDDAVSLVKTELETVDFSDICAQLMERKYHVHNLTSDEFQKMKAALIRNGFTGSNIREALERISKS